VAFEQQFEHNGNWLVSDDRARLDMETVHGYLKTCYWAEGITREQLERQTTNSTLAFGLYRCNGQGETCGQIGFARVLSDLCHFAYMSDVIVLPQWQRQGLGTRMLKAMLSHPELVGMRYWVLMTRDAHNLYRRLGFHPPEEPHEYLELKHPQGSPWV